jgi:hypothetical protein
VVADSEGTCYRHSGITSDGDWMEADNAYFKRWGIPLRVKGGA